jgi:hypothetical protein
VREWLDGGNVTSVERIGDMVRRATGPWSPAVHALLRHLEAVGYVGAPRLLGTDAEGREKLSFVDGDVPIGADPSIVTDAALADVGHLIRSLHAATADFALPPGVTWHFRSRGGPQPHVVCHHDLSPKNTVFRDGRVVAFIDWDMATPEAPIHDLVHAVWQYVPLATDEECARQGWRTPPDRGRRARDLIDAYGLPTAERVGFAARVAKRMDITASGIDELAATGRPAFRRLVERGVPDRIRQDHAWVIAQAATLDRTVVS